MQIKLSDKYKLTHDGAQWRVIEHKPPEEIKKGKFKGQTTEGGWKLLEKFWPHPSQALRYVLEQEISHAGSEMEIDQFQQWFDERLEDMKKMFDN